MRDLKNGQRRLNLLTLCGWIISLAGSALWIYGYFFPGNASLIDWPAVSPMWIAEFFPNVQAEVGFALSIGGTLMIYWPNSQKDR